MPRTAPPVGAEASAPAKEGSEAVEAAVERETRFLRAKMAEGLVEESLWLD
jgi:hypothetical protein